jgi:hypothetical protein
LLLVSREQQWRRGRFFSNEKASGQRRRQQRPLSDRHKLSINLYFRAPPQPADHLDQLSRRIYKRLNKNHIDYFTCRRCNSTNQTLNPVNLVPITRYFAHYADVIQSTLINMRGLWFCIYKKLL